MSINANQEMFMIMEILGRRALFSNFRMEAESIPDGLSWYELREGVPQEEYNEFGESNPPTLSIAKSVWCDHFGTIILRDPIQEAEKGEFEICDDDWGFLGDEVRLNKGVQWLSQSVQ